MIKRQQNGRTTLNVFVIEDNPGDLRILQALLLPGPSFEFVLNSASHLLAAIETLMNEQVDVILLDLNLPDSSGIDTMEQLISQVKEIPVVILTGTQDMELALAAVRLGAADFLPKDELTEDLIQRTLYYAVERFQMTRELETSRENFRRMSESLPDPLLILDADNRVLYANRSARVVFDPHMQGIEGKGLGLPELRGFVGEFSHRDVLGNTRRLELRDSKTNWGGHSARLVLFRDLTELDERQRELEESRKRFINFFDSLSSSVLLLQPDESGDDFRLMDLNPSATIFIVPERDQSVNMKISDILPCIGSCPVLELLKDTARDGAHRSLAEVKCTHHDHPGYRNVQCFRLADGSVALVIDDVTEKVRRDHFYTNMDEQLRQMQKLESIGRLAGGIAHDFNNILAAIISYGELIHGDLHEQDPMRKDVRDIIRTAERGASLTGQLLAFSRRQVLQPVTMDVNQALNSLESLIRRLIGEDIELKITVDRDVWPVFVDNSQFDQVFLNLATNSRDAMPQGGRLELRVENQTLTESLGTPPETIPPGDYTVFHVTDSGGGIPDDIRKHLFEPFFTTKDKGKGTGLGLSTVWGIIRQSQGLITLESYLDEGTTFHIYLPRSREQVTPESTRHHRQELIRGQGERILVVEDEAMILDLTHRLLTRNGYSVVKARNPGEALLICEQASEKPQLLISDVVMPEMNGAALLERLQDQIPELKVIFMSGYTDDTMEKNGLDPSAVPFIQKPFKADRMIALVQKVLGSSGKID